MGRSDLTPAARRLRAASTDAERKLWRSLQASQLAGFKFRRQLPIGGYVVDFACLEARLVVEVDGGQHADSADDKERDAWLRSQGFRVLRFWNNDVLSNTEGVLTTIAKALAPSPQPSPIEGEGARRRRRSTTAGRSASPSPQPSPVEGEGARRRRRPRRQAADAVAAPEVDSPSLEGRGQGGG